MSLGFFGATDKNLTESDSGMGVGEISIQLQRMFTFGDALGRALGQYVDKSQKHMASRMVRNQRQGFGQFHFGRYESPAGSVTKEICALDLIRARRSNQRVDIVGVGQQRAIEKTARLLQL